MLPEGAAIVIAEQLLGLLLHRQRSTAQPAARVVVVMLSVLLGGLSSAAAVQAGISDAATDGSAIKAGNNPVSANLANDEPWSAAAYGALYAEKTDAELTQLSASWDALAPEQQKALLNEVKLRMIRKRGRQGGPAVLSARRFGRIVQQADGSMVRIETQVLRVSPGRAGYGVGFEIRAQRRSAATAGDLRELLREPLDIPVEVSVQPPAADRRTEGRPGLPLLKAVDPRP